ncbi:MAG: formyltetrahydrofolate deformylase [Ilumatobacteraceae bacterium]|nr:formyltetrahydrofolate deformylase [Actinomycetota bacterium]MDA3012181.1 formyltetrahydrofolate deformylase [Actinomycetota bacterium]MDA3025165.1 formyltetrahydrofolate deformylase [Actinomycetota bacterium]NBU55517.1 formyltetrahydrofolate deformylase [Acidimicrobiia bacterium]
MPGTGVLLLSCPDQRGVVASVAEFIASNNGNIVHAEQHTDEVEHVFFQRVEFELEGFGVGRDDILTAFSPVASKFDMSVDLRFTDVKPRIAIMASKQPHCLFDLLTRWRAGELPADVVGVIDNHPDHADLVEHMGVPYFHLPVSPGAKEQQESEVLDTLASLGVDLVVLARYMQILSPRIVDAYRSRIINIHHSFLPAFIGANPYRQAHDRGVKLIGATAHYVTEELDEGPILDQEVSRVTHRDSVAELTRKGRDLETIVLARAVRAHLEHRVLVYGRKTVVFG